MFLKVGERRIAGNRELAQRLFRGSQIGMGTVRKRHRVFRGRRPFVSPAEIRIHSSERRAYRPQRKRQIYLPIDHLPPIVSVAELLMTPPALITTG